MNPKAVTVDAGASVQEAIEIMRNRAVPALVVCRNDEPVGALTEHDMLMDHVTESGHPAGSSTVHEIILKREAIRCREDAILADAIHAMVNHDIRSVPVVNADGGLVGVLMLVDVLGALTPDVAAAWLAKMQESSPAS